jgi:hypothetical protein
VSDPNQNGTDPGTLPGRISWPSDPDPLFRITNPQIRIQEKHLRSHYTGLNNKENLSSEASRKEQKEGTVTMMGNYVPERDQVPVTSEMGGGGAGEGGKNFVKAYFGPC